MSATQLWYTNPPSEYMNGLPIGTGRLAAMVLGKPDASGSLSTTNGCGGARTATAISRSAPTS